MAKSKKRRKSKVKVTINGDRDLWVRRIVAITKLVAALSTLALTVIAAIRT